MQPKIHPIDKDVETRIEELKEKAQHLEHDMEIYAKTVSHYIKENPIRSTIMAGVAGIFLGKLFGK